MVSQNNNSKYILNLNGISKSFPGVKALDKVNLNLAPGSVHALCGENGAGKSTLIKTLNGIYKRDEGEIILNGKPIVPENPKQMLDLGIATIHQELSPIPDMTIAENIFLGREPLNRLGNIDWDKMYNDTQKLLDEYGFNYDPKTVMRYLTVSDTALIEILKAVSREAKVIIMDEPTSSITDSEVHILFNNINKLREKGVGIIYITHKMDEVFEICDEVTILRDGQWIYNSPISQITKDEIIRLMVGRELTDQFPTKKAKIGDIVFELKDFCGEKFNNINLDVRKGEIVGIAGLVGAGRTELFRTVFGLDKCNAGKILLNNNLVQVNSPSDAIRQGIIMTSEDRKKEGVVLIRSIRENISLASLEKIERKGLLSIKEEKKHALKMFETMDIKARSMEDQVSSLSGGNQQKVVLAKWLLLDPEILIMDEPTRGIDVGAKYEIYKLMCELAESGVAIVMISSEMPETMGMCDRIYIMSQGEITGEIDKPDYSQEKIMRYAVKGFEK